MIKTSFRIMILVLSLITLVILAGCGGGTGGASNPVVTLKSAASEVPAGTYMPVTVTISADFPTLSGFEFQIESDNVSIIPSVGSTKSNNGTAYANVYVKNISTQTQTVRIRAKLKDGDVYSPWVPLTVKPATLTLTPPAATSFSQTADSTTKLCSGGVANIVITGASIKLSDSSVIGASEQPVTISVTSISNGIVGFDNILLYPSGYSSVEISLATNAFTSNTDTNGIWLLPLVIQGVVPTVSTGQHVFAVNWEATALRIGDDATNLSYRVTGQTMLTLSCD
jgi:hypothetical protein